MSTYVGLFSELETLVRRRFSSRSVIGVSIGRGEGKFVLLELAFYSTLEGQVCNFVFVPEKTG